MSSRAPISVYIIYLLSLSLSSPSLPPPYLHHYHFFLIFNFSCFSSSSSCITLVTTPSSGQLPPPGVVPRGLLRPLLQLSQQPGLLSHQVAPQGGTQVSSGGQRVSWLQGVSAPEPS